MCTLKNLQFAAGEAAIVSALPQRLRCSRRGYEKMCTLKNLQFAAGEAAIVSALPQRPRCSDSGYKRIFQLSL